MLPAALITLARVILGGLLIFSGVIKFFGLRQFAIIVASYGVLPRQLVKPLAYGQPVIETIIGLWLLSDYELRWAALAGLAVFVVATFFVLAALIKKKKMENCGCYGTLIKVPLTWRKFFENLVWIALAALLTWSAWA